MSRNVENPSTFDRKKRNELYEFTKAQRQKISSLNAVAPWVSFFAGVVGFFVMAGLTMDILSVTMPFLWMALAIGAGYLTTRTVRGKFDENIANLSALINRRTTEVEDAISENLDQWRSSEDRELQKRISADEGEADLRMSRSKLVHEIAQCIFPKFKEIVSGQIAGAHLNVNARLELRVFRDRIQFGDANDAKSFKNFVFKEEGIRDELTPIYRKALCKALVSDLRVLLLEAFPVDPKRKIVQVGLEGSVKLVNGSGYRYGYTSTAPEYDNNSHAEAIILYQATENKATRRF